MIPRQSVDPGPPYCYRTADKSHGKGRIIQDGVTEQTVVFTGQCLRYGIRDGIYKQDVAVTGGTEKPPAVINLTSGHVAILYGLLNFL